MIGGNLKEYRKLLERIVEHGNRVDGKYYTINCVVVERHFAPGPAKGLFLTYAARIGEHKCSERTTEKEALHALIGVLGSMRSFEERQSTG